MSREYNSLDAEYDACAAYALSQRHEGGTVVSERYDVVDRKLTPNATEAETVRHVMRRYVAWGSPENPQYQMQSELWALETGPIILAVCPESRGSPTAVPNAVC